MRRIEDDTPERELPTLLTRAAAELTAAGVASPRVDAELLAAHVLGVPRGRLLTAAITREQADALAELIRRRAARIPLQHLMGSAPFYGLELAVGPGVFVPRFETELLVEWGLRQPGTAVVDLCGGSGAIAVAFATRRPAARVYCVERSPQALPWLRRNVEHLAPAVVVVEADVAGEPGPAGRSALSALAGLHGAVDLVLSNPPYVPEATPVDVEVAEHDPYEAVFAGADGLALMPAIARTAARLLRPGGRLGIEHDDTQGASLPELLRATGWFTAVEDHRDLAGRPRFTTATRAETPPD